MREALRRRTERRRFAPPKPVAITVMELSPHAIVDDRN
jgi:hypothetical protein